MGSCASTESNVVNYCALWLLKDGESVFAYQERDRHRVNARVQE